MISGLSALVRSTMPLDALQRHPGIARMQVGDDGDLQLEAGRPLRRRRIVARDAQPHQRLDAKTIGRGGDAERAEPAD